MEGIVLGSHLRSKFTREEEVKYISHLDLMLVFERALRRARIPIAYSGGFNPHPQMVFGLPLSVGVTSESEYADFEFHAEVDPENFKSRLNANLPQGLKILEVRERKAKGNIMASIAIASYDIFVYLGCSYDIIQERLKELLSKTTIVVQKKGKKGVKDLDIRPMIHKLHVLKLSKNEIDEKLNSKFIDLDRIHLNEDNGIYCIRAVLSAGSNANLKPELLMEAIKEGLNFDINTLKIHRTELLVGKGGKVYNPLDPVVLLGE
ncbi:MAG: TIGR03936 family radical SAM-associated protein [Clostridia bacterium]|nr:TIGR03936 family radical SAM-associated protein [Clostridia bacterium]